MYDLIEKNIISMQTTWESLEIIRLHKKKKLRKGIKRKGKEKVMQKCLKNDVGGQGPKVK